MSKITKGLLLCSMLTSSTLLWAASTSVTFTGPGTVTQAGGAGTPASTACNSLNGADTVTIAISANNGGGYACNGVNVGVAVASSKGRGIVYSTNSNGGNAINQTANGARFTDQAAAATASGARAVTEVDTLAGT